MKKKTLYERCQAVYETLGQRATHAYAIQQGVKAWANCPACECNSPVRRGFCLVCGTRIRPTTKKRRAR